MRSKIINGLLGGATLITLVALIFIAADSFM